VEMSRWKFRKAHSRFHLVWMVLMTTIFLLSQSRSIYITWTVWTEPKHDSDLPITSSSTGSFLRIYSLTAEINLERLSNFIHWWGTPPLVSLNIQPQVSKRSEKTINQCLTTVSGFYEFQEHLGAFEGVATYRHQMQPGSRYKPFLHHISKGKEVKTKLVKIKEPKTFPDA